ncbi:MAG TPA: GerMN domain-containing protein [Candidatus Blautia stercoravium]|nr:GerMN domain-containing protein [Candidatus Blautia stercoravium]
MKKMMKTVLLLLTALILLNLSGCKEEEKQESKTEYHMYYLSLTETALEETDYVPSQRTSEAMVNEIVEMLGKEPENEEYLSLLPKGVTIENCTYEGQTVTLTFNEEYKKMKNTREILARAGIVKALTQIPGVSYVEFYQGQEAMTDADGQKIGKMDVSTFVENEGENINSYVHNDLNLYFASKDGENLVKEKVSVYYSSNVPIEREVVERLLKGPNSSDLQPTLSPNTKILGVSIAEGICYVNLDKSFLSDTMNVQEKLPIYSIVNSLTDACNLRGVQISVEGETKVTFRESMKLNEIYHADYSLVQDSEEAEGNHE